MAPFVGPNELLQRLERLEKLVEEHGRRFEDLAPKGQRRSFPGGAHAGLGGAEPTMIRGW